jgi:hypothetical protein
MRICDVNAATCALQAVQARVMTRSCARRSLINAEAGFVALAVHASGLPSTRFATRGSRPRDGQIATHTTPSVGRTTEPLAAR